MRKKKCPSLQWKQDELFQVTEGTTISENPSIIYNENNISRT
jgi:hypothetical protein